MLSVLLPVLMFGSNDETGVRVQRNYVTVLSSATLLFEHQPACEYAVCPQAQTFRNV